MSKRRMLSNILKNNYTGYKQNAMVSISWVIGIVEVFFMQGLIWGPSLWIQISCLVMMVALLGFYCYSFRHFMLKDPDRLQSESYNIVKNIVNALTEDEKEANLKIDENFIPINKPPEKRREGDFR